MHYFLASSSQKGKLATYRPSHLPKYTTRRYLGSPRGSVPQEAIPQLPSVSRGDESMYGLLTRLSGQARLTLQIPLPWNPSEMSISDKDLFQYCVSTYCPLELRHAIRLTKHSPICGFPVSHHLRPQPSCFGQCPHACRSHKQVKLGHRRSAVAPCAVLTSSIWCPITGGQAENREPEGTGGSS